MNFIELVLQAATKAGVDNPDADLFPSADTAFATFKLPADAVISLDDAHQLRMKLADKFANDPIGRGLALASWAREALGSLKALAT